MNKKTDNANFRSCCILKFVGKVNAGGDSPTLQAVRVGTGLTTNSLKMYMFWLTKVGCLERTRVSQVGTYYKLTDEGRMVVNGLKVAYFYAGELKLRLTDEKDRVKELVVTKGLVMLEQKAKPAEPEFHSILTPWSPAMSMGGNARIAKVRHG